MVLNVPRALLGEVKEMQKLNKLDNVSPYVVTYILCVFLNKNKVTDKTKRVQHKYFLKHR